MTDGKGNRLNVGDTVKAIILKMHEASRMVQLGSEDCNDWVDAPVIEKVPEPTTAYTKAEILKVFSRHSSFFELPEGAIEAFFIMLNKEKA